MTMRIESASKAAYWLVGIYCLGISAGASADNSTGSISAVNNTTFSHKYLSSAVSMGNELHDPFSALFQEWRDLENEDAPIGSPITVSVAADIVGRPVRFAQRGFETINLAAQNGGQAAIGRLTGSMPTSLPLASRRLTSAFGFRSHPTLGGRRLHKGVDLAAPRGTPVVATSDGIVSAAGWNGGYGLFVAVEHGTGIQTRYAHMSQLNVSAGQRVQKGQIVGLVGSTGRSTGPHLHYETRINGVAVNPLR